MEKDYVGGMEGPLAFGRGLIAGMKVREKQRLTAICRIANYRKSVVGKVQAHLMHATGHRHTYHQSISPKPFHGLSEG